VPADLPEQLDRALRADTPWRQQLEPIKSELNGLVRRYG